MAKLEGKIALITGGSTGIGLATAILFQKEGAKVIVTGRTQSSLDEAQKELGPDALVLKADASKLEDTVSVVEQIKAKFGRIDILFANAGVATFSPAAQVDEAAFDNMFDINVKGLFFTVQKALPLISSGGSILLNASVVSRKGFPGTSVYSATKAAVRSFGRTLAAELAAQGIRVNTISPGPISTPIYGKLGMDAASTKTFEENMASTVALKRFGLPEEIAKVAVFLASDDASYVVGTELFVDGGMAEL
jgi:NAD(P)-dependent dehydrogenase (short-subunit alcohol dehydrogenase family)